MGKRYSVLFVCLGNICRSPLAEGVFRSLAVGRGVADRFDIDSCGTGPWHEGEPPHRESCKVASKHGVSIEGLRARQVCRDDFKRFDLIVAMDRSNLEDLRRLCPGAGPEIVLLRDFDPTEPDPDVPDPFYGGADGFEDVFQIVHRCCEQLLERLSEKMV